MGGDHGASSSSGGGSGGETVVIDHGRRRGPCGYCRSPGYTSLSHGLWANSLTVNDYQELLDCGWRRSGSYIYKPEMDRTCCPSYTIRLNADNFIPSKEQVRLQKKMQRFLDGMLSLHNSKRLKSENVQKSSKGLLGTEVGATSATSQAAVNQTSKPSTSNVCEDTNIRYLSNIIKNAVKTCSEKSNFSSIHMPEAIIKKVTPQAKKKLKGISEDLLYTSSISFQVASTLRHLYSLENNSSGLANLQNGKNSDISPNGIAERLVAAINEQGELPGLCVGACNGHLNFYPTTKCTGSVLSTIAHAQTSKMAGDDPNRCSTAVSSTVSPQRKRRLEIIMKRSSFQTDEFALYAKYQINVHNDKPEKVTESSYRRFLVDTPLIYVPPDDKNKSIPYCGFGSFHQRYLIDGRLVAVGVVDILPKCLSSKYLFWDPDFSSLSLGKYSALQEINWVKETHGHCSSLQYYYLGYYIHSCNKMRYKASYRPSELLCPLRYEWVPFNIAKPLLDEKPYVVLSDFVAGRDGILSSQALSEPIRQSPKHVNHDEESDEEEDSMEVEFEDVDTSMEDESDPGSSGEPGIEGSGHVDISNIVLDLDGHVKFKDLQEVAFIQKKHMRLLESQLRRYVKVVGKELSSRMIYSIV